MMAKKYQQGVTLLEMMIVIAIIAIIAAVAVPSFSRLLERNRIKAAAESLKSDLQLARTQAIKKSSNVQVTRTIGNDGAWCYGFNSGGTACDCTETDTSQADYCALTIVKGDDFKKTNLISSNATTFDFRRGTANAGNTCFSTTNYKLKVMVSNVGRVTICSDTTAPVGGYDDCAANC